MEILILTFDTKQLQVEVCIVEKGRSIESYGRNLSKKE